MATFRVVIVDDRLTTWMFFNNVFTATKHQLDQSRGTWQWHGVLIHLGQYEDVDGELIRGFKEITITRENQEPQVLVSAEEIKDQKQEIWINVWARTDREDPPIGVHHAAQLIPTDERSLHQYFEPYASVITLWTQNGYQVEVKPTDVESVRNSHTFVLNQDTNITVQVYRQGVPDAPIENASQITITREIVVPPGDTNGPPI